MTTRTRIDYAAARRAMIDSQLRTSGVTEAFVLERMGTVPREDYVPDAMKSAAYMDRAVRLADGGFLPAPLFHGTLLSEARPDLADRALVVDAGSGYLPALVEPLVGRMTVIDPAAAAAGRAEGDNTLILVDGAIEHVPDAFAALLAPEGRLVTGMVERGVTRFAAGRRSGEAVALLPLAEMGIPRLGAFDAPPIWSF